MMIVRGWSEDSGSRSQVKRKGLKSGPKESLIGGSLRFGIGVSVITESSERRWLKLQFRKSQLVEQRMYLTQYLTDGKLSVNGSHSCYFYDHNLAHICPSLAQ